MMDRKSVTGRQDLASDQPQLGKVVTVQIVTMLIAVISMLIDGVMTGVFLGDNCLAAYGLTNPVNMLLVALGGLLASGAQVLSVRRAAARASLHPCGIPFFFPILFTYCAETALSITITFCPEVQTLGRSMEDITSEAREKIVRCLGE